MQNAILFVAWRRSSICGILFLEILLFQRPHRNRRRRVPSFSVDADLLLIMLVPGSLRGARSPPMPPEYLPRCVIESNNTTAGGNLTTNSFGPFDFCVERPPNTYSYASTAYAHPVVPKEGIIPPLSSSRRPIREGEPHPCV